MDANEFGQSYLCFVLECGMLKALDETDWIEIACSPDIPLKYLEYYENLVPWDYVALRPGLSETFMLKWEDRLNWEDISRFQDLSADFLWRHSDLVDWNVVFMFQDLDEEFIKFIDNNGIPVNWHSIYTYQRNISSEFQGLILTKMTFNH